MTTRQDSTTVAQIKEACRRIIEFTRGHDEESLLNDLKTQPAVLH